MVQKPKFLRVIVNNNSSSISEGSLNNNDSNSHSSIKGVKNGSSSSSSGGSESGADRTNTSNTVIATDPDTSIRSVTAFPTRSSNSRVVEKDEASYHSLPSSLLHSEMATEEDPAAASASAATTVALQLEQQGGAAAKITNKNERPELSVSTLSREGDFGWKPAGAEISGATSTENKSSLSIITAAAQSAPASSNSTNEVGSGGRSTGYGNMSLLGKNTRSDANTDKFSATLSWGQQEQEVSVATNSPFIHPVCTAPERGLHLHCQENGTASADFVTQNDNTAAVEEQFQNLYAECSAAANEQQEQPPCRRAAPRTMGSNLSFRDMYTDGDTAEQRGSNEHGDDGDDDPQVFFSYASGGGGSNSGGDPVDHHDQDSYSPRPSHSHSHQDMQEGEELEHESYGATTFQTPIENSILENARGGQQKLHHALHEQQRHFLNTPPTSLHAVALSETVTSTGSECMKLPDDSQLDDGQQPLLHSDALYPSSRGHGMFAQSILQKPLQNHDGPSSVEVSVLAGSHASSDASSFNTTKSQHHQPVLYSAIGSLEDPTNNSFAAGGWRNRLQQSNKKIEFPSCQGFIPPANQVMRYGGRGGNTDSSNNNSSKTLGGRKDSSTSAQGIVIQSNTASNAKSRATSLASKQQQQESNSSQQLKNGAGARTDSSTDVTGSENAPTTATRTSASSAAASAKISNTTTAGIQSSTAGDLATSASALPSSLKTSFRSTLPGDKSKENKKVTIAVSAQRKKSGNKQKKKQKGPVEMFRPSSDAYTPRMGKKQIKYKPAEMRTPVQQMASGLGTLSRPNFRDALRRVAMIIHQHIVKIERRFESSSLRKDDGLFMRSMMEEFHEERFETPTYKCTMVRIPMARSGFVYGLKRIRRVYEIPSEAEIYEFAHQLFKAVQLSSECSIVCLIYIERLMEIAKVPLLACTWRPIFMCGLLLASKVWQDLSSWNIEFASVYPQYSLDAINRLELQFLRMVKWDLYISSSNYAKYYFALRSLVEKQDFRQRYNRMVGGVDSVQASEALKIEKRSTQVKEEALLQLSRSM